MESDRTPHGSKFWWPHTVVICQDILIMGRPDWRVSPDDIDACGSAVGAGRHNLETRDRAHCSRFGKWPLGRRTQCDDGKAIGTFQDLLEDRVEISECTVRSSSIGILNSISFPMPGQTIVEIVMLSEPKLNRIKTHSAGKVDPSPKIAPTASLAAPPLTTAAHSL